ncbi:DUF11 domain-containing protein [Aurantiacibacter aquimixticola]|uniref:DUF11 domain-containing protein n=2 Tax=Aurantiacibacter aquimixticola TaxID=1958945 RepID=A0A419RWI5_9SPHN|nr:DUF11 domain-containing protein [Aurantiacibacter aquimixticola]
MLQAAAALLIALLSFVVLEGSASAQTITNVAEARWDHEGRSFTGRSNLVELRTDRTTSRVRTYVPGTDTPLTYFPSFCAASGGTATPSGGAAVGANAVETGLLVAGQDLLFAVELPAANLDASAVETVDVVLSSNSGDREELTVYETSANSGVFMGSISTRRMPPAPVRGDCRLSLENGNAIVIDVLARDGSSVILTTTMDVLADPFGVVFDSESGQPVDGATVTLVDAITGQPARVFAADGVTPWPSTVISGAPVTDAAGNVTQMDAGEFWFPLTSLGTYRLVVTPPAPYTAPSAATPDQLSRITRPDGRAFVISDASYGDTFRLDSPIPVQVDIPLDRPGVSVSLVKTASRDQAQPGDVIFYSLTVRNPDSAAKNGVVLTDVASPYLRLRRDTIRIDGEEAGGDVIDISDDGRTIALNLGDLAAGAQRRVTYAMTVLPDAPAGHAENFAFAIDSIGRRVETSASVEVLRDTIAGRMTIIGRVTAGPCSLTDDMDRIGIPGVRVMMEDGSFAITDIDGRYHFDGVVPGTHVVQASRMTLPEGGEFTDCTRSSRSQGSAITRLVTGRGGSLAVVDYHATVPADTLGTLRAITAPIVTIEDAGFEIIEGEQTDSTADLAGTVEAVELQDADRFDWLSFGDGEIDWLAPAIDANPRVPSIRVAIRHRRGQTVTLFVDGEEVSPLSFEGVMRPAEGRWEVSHWRGISLAGGRTELTAHIMSGAGKVVAELEREVFFTTIPARVELVPEQSALVADGRTAPVVAVRVLDAAGRPIREGVSGELKIGAPYESAEQVARQQLDQLTRRGPASARWTVTGADGIAFIELAPTMVSGSLSLDFRFDDGEIVREQQLEGWIVPGDIEWTVIGLAEGTIGARSVADNMERTGSFDSDLGDDARVALYAKGRILGRYLVTLAYDSAAQEDDARLLGTLDPNAYYTVFADGSSRRFDAASREKLYVRIETASFNALYGDFETGFDDTRLLRYQRVATGISAEARQGQVSLRAFGAEIGTRFRRDEIQGQGISGPYTLSSRAIIPNSETVTLEVRDRFRSEIIVDSRTLTRFADYDIDLLSGTIRFREPMLSRDFNLNPQFIVIAYEVDELGDGEINAGIRAEWTSRDGAVQVGTTAVTDRGDGARTLMGGVDLQAQLDPNTELRAELAASQTDGDTATGWLIEAQHQTGSLDIIAYARETEADYGVGQQNGVELGRRKLGVDSRVRFGDDLTVLASLWQDDSLADAARRRAAQVELGYTTQATDFRLGLGHFNDRLPDGTTNTSTVIEGGVTQRAMDNRLELSASTSIALDDAESVDLPARHRLGARYAITDDVRIVGQYELADGVDFTSSSLRGGLEFTPWLGGQFNASVGEQDISELGTRSFAAFGLAQTLQVNAELSVDATFDSNWTIDGEPSVADVVNTLQPVASGGQFGPGGSLFEEFTAVTAGAAWRRERWSATARGEYRDGEFADRTGFTAGLVRQLGEGRVLGSGLTWTRASGANGTETEILDAALAWAHRPADSEFAFLSKVEYRSDEVRNASAGEAGPVGRTALTVEGDARASRLIGSVSANWSPRAEKDRDNDEQAMFTRRSEFGAFLAVRHNFDRFEGFDLSSTSLLTGLDARIGLGERFEVGASATLRTDLEGGYTSYAFGPNVGFVPVEGVLLTVGYNVAGFDDPDFSAMRNIDEGIFAAVRMKIDADTFGFLGLGR